METHLLKPLTDDIKRLHKLFEKIASGNTILFLGAGASVTSKQYLSKTIIEYYEDKVGKSYGIENITEFLDALSVTDGFDRAEFDNYVYDLLSKLKFTEAHKTILSIKWRQIITTNFDQLLERAEVDFKESSNSIYELIPVRASKDLYFLCDNNQVKYIKLNGCMSDKKKYPFLFSTQDFKRAKNFYNTVLTGLQTVSDNITFLSVGYSYADEFAKQLLERFDQFKYRDRKPMWNVDPFVNDSKLALYKSQGVFIIKCTVQEFFAAYREWEEKTFANRLKLGHCTIFTTSNNSIVPLVSSPENRTVLD